jgi:maltooligosyltrehalose trehalohydrolase
VELIIGPDRPSSRRVALQRASEGCFTATVADVTAGDLYTYRLDGEGPFPDPASRFQPHGVHGPSEVIDPSRFVWSDNGWRGVSIEDAVLYELHIGTFTDEGTFAAAIDRLPDLADLGVTVVELMPVADFPGTRNWGYDGASLFAPSRAYGRPDDLRRFVDRAHRLGLGVVLDVVYNHFGPDGAYASVFSPFYISTRHRSPWGAAVNLDGEGARQVREFFVENALHWIHEYHVDGLRLDATHSLVDSSPRHFVAELASRVRASLPHRQTLLIAEDDRNLATLVQPVTEGGWGLDAVWADDFHHQIRRLSAGDRDGYYEDFTGTTSDLATTIRDGWFYRGQFSAHSGKPRGTEPAGLPLCRMIVCLQNHDQIGNRPFGQRLHHQIEPALYRALTAVLLFAPETPLMFMGQEWAASTPFLFFTDHNRELGRLVSEGRRDEFSRFEAFADPVTRARIPDPQALSTFERSRLLWDERARPPHAGVLELYRVLLRLRRSETTLRRCDAVEAGAPDDASLVIVRRGEDEAWLLAMNIGAGRRLDLTRWRSAAPHGRWQLVLSTEEPLIQDPGDSGARAAVTIDLGEPLAVTFVGPAAAILRGR